MKKILSTLLAVLLVSPVLFAEEKKSQEWNEPQIGTWAIGITFNPVSLASRLTVQPKAGTAVNGTISGSMAIQKQLYALSQDPVLAIRAKYRVANEWNLRMALGFSGSHINYAEYVQDDIAVLQNPASGNRVTDVVKSDLTSGNLVLGAEYVKGRRVKFTMGFSLMYAIGGGALNFAYGNRMSALNPVPTSMPFSGWINGEGAALNPDNGAAKAQGIEWARPLKTNNSGVHHGLGINMDMGIEWFFQERISLGAAVTFSPIMLTFQPQTHSVMEGFSSITGKVEQYNMLISPGSWSCLYGTENIGFQLSLNYYL